MGPVVVGLGNPGPAHAGTRHNVGQAVIDRLAARLGADFRGHEGALLARATWRGEPLHLAKPVALMNVQGAAVLCLLRALDRPPEALVVVHDDLDLPFGRVRVRQRGGHGGHNGMRSVLAALGTEEVRRVKVGIGRPARGPAGDAGPTGDPRTSIVEWVLTPFTVEEQAALPGVLDRAADAVLGLLGGSAPARPDPDDRGLARGQGGDPVI